MLVDATTYGWVGIGFGASMTNTDMVLFTTVGNTVSLFIYSFIQFFNLFIVSYPGVGLRHLLDWTCFTEFYRILGLGNYRARLDIWLVQGESLTYAKLWW